MNTHLPGPQVSTLGTWVHHAYDTVGSTMDVARELIDASPEVHRCVITARHQTKGRGRQGRAWHSPGDVLAATFILRRSASGDGGRSVGDLSGLSLAVGVALSDWCAELKLDVRLKWPNDVLSLRGDKLAGVLIELLNREGVTYVLIGIGMNISHAPPEVPHSTCLATLREYNWTPDQVLSGVAEHLGRAWELFEARGMEAFIARWSKVAWGIGEPIQVQQGECMVSGQMQGIAPDGALLVGQDSGAVIRVTSGILL